jgi:hypothetical protein
MSLQSTVHKAMGFEYCGAKLQFKGDKSVVMGKNYDGG